MAKKSMIAKDLKRKKLIEKYAAKRVLHDLRTATILMVDHAVTCDDLV